MASSDQQKKLNAAEPQPPSRSSNNDVPWYRQLLAIKNTLIIIITPLFFLPLLVAYPTPVYNDCCCIASIISIVRFNVA